ncbi:hypothetical protein ACFSTC_21115 [Nonomuraea ferruginea]
MLGGMPYNVTTEMDLELWDLAVRAREHRELFLGTPPEELAAGYFAGDLPDIGMAGFLEKYGMRAAAEIDVGVPHWDEDPAPLFATIANYLRVDDPGQAPDVRFRAAAAKAERMIATLSRRARRRRPVRGLAGGVLHAPLAPAHRAAGDREVRLAARDPGGPAATPPGRRGPGRP